MEWVQVGSRGTEEGTDGEDRFRRPRRRGQRDNSVENSPSDESEDTMDVGDAIFGLNKQKMWEKYVKADTFDIFCADVERRIHLTILIPYRQDIESDSLGIIYRKTDVHLTTG